jgi:phosphatidylglycerophosphatase C
VAMSEQAVAAAEQRIVAAFDFDSTLTKRETLRLFFVEWCGWQNLGRALFEEAPSMLAGALLRGRHRDRAKATLMHRLLAGRSQEEGLQAARRVADRILRSGLRSDTNARLFWHLSQGHEVIIISGAFEAYVGLVARSLGVHAVLATRWEVDESEFLTGGLAGPNVRGPAKASLLREYLQGREALVYAYGNSTGDRELLEAAAIARRVRRYSRLAPCESLRQSSVSDTAGDREVQLLAGGDAGEYGSALVAADGAEQA